MEYVVTVILYLLYIYIMTQMAGMAFTSKYKTNRNLGWMMILLFPSLLAAFRGRTGTDSYMYQQIYEGILQREWQTMEFGYACIMEVLNACHFSYRVLFFIMQFLTVLFIMLFINNEKENIDARMAVLIFASDLFFWTLNGMRQGLAIAIVLYAFSVFMDGKWKKSIALIILASVFHMSALIAFVVLGAKWLFENRYTRVIIAICVGVILWFIFHRDQLGYLAYKLSGSAYYASYITRDAQSEGSIINVIIKCFPILFICALNFKNYRGNAKKYKIYFAMMICGYVFTLLGVITATFVERAAYYFTYLNICLLAFASTQPLVVYKWKFSCQIVKYVVIAYVMVMFSYNTVYRNFNDLIPYYGLFSNG